MLHLITEIGQPGRQERERRHFYSLYNKESEPAEKNRARRYISHGYGTDKEVRPHPQHVDPQYTECGLDWKSRLRWIPSPTAEDIDYKPEIWPDAWKSIRAYPYLPGTFQTTDKEWSLYKEGYGSTMRSKWNGVHKATRMSSQEVTHTMLYGKGKIVVDKRNGFAQAAPGDKSYQAVEYSKDFHKKGCTLPLVNFGRGKEAHIDRYLQRQAPLISRPRYTAKEKERQRLEEMNDVRSLERWRPATPLTQTAPSAAGISADQERTPSSRLTL